MRRPWVVSVAVSAAASAAALRAPPRAPLAARGASRRVAAPRTIVAAAAAADDDEDLEALDAAARAAGERADAVAPEAVDAVAPEAVEAAAPSPTDDDAFWAAVAAAKLVTDGGEAYPRGRVVDASRVNVVEAQKRGVLDLAKADSLRWAQDESRIVVFAPWLEGVKARDIYVDIGVQSLGLLVKGRDIVKRAPLLHDVDADAAAWTLEEGLGLVIDLPKNRDDIVWSSLLDGRTDEELAEALEGAFNLDIGDDGGDFLGDDFL